MSTSCGTVRLVAGPAGDDGADGANGTDGVSAFTLLTAQFTMPAEAATAGAVVQDTSWMVPGNIYYLEGAGWLQATAIPDATHVTLLNLEDTANSLYTDNVAPGTVIAVAAKLTVGGSQGPAGTVTPASVFLVANNLSEGVAATKRSNLGLDTMATQAANAVAITGGAISGITDLAVADGGTGASNAAGARTNLGLGTMAVQAAGAVAITGGSIVGITDLAVADGGTGASTAAAARTNLGVNRTLQDYLLYQHQLASTTNAGDFTSGSWQTVPLNTEVADTGAHGSIAANTVTLATGVYRARWRVVGYQVGNFQGRLFNVTTAAVIGYGSNATSAAADGCTAYSNGEARFTVSAATENIRIEAQCQTTNAGDGFGLANSFGGTEVYASLELQREVG